MPRVSKFEANTNNHHTCNPWIFFQCYALHSIYIVFGFDWVWSWSDFM